MKNRIKNIIKKEEGQGMTEYIIIVALIGIAAIGIVTLFGDTLRDLFGASASALTGADAKRYFGEKENVSKHRELDNFAYPQEAYETALQ